MRISIQFKPNKRIDLEFGYKTPLFEGMDWFSIVICDLDMYNGNVEYATLWLNWFRHPRYWFNCWGGRTRPTPYIMDILGDPALNTLIMNKPYEFKKIDDVEVLLDSLQIYHRNCVGPKKCGKDMILRIKHKHPMRTDNTDIGYVDVFLTTYQAAELIKELANMMATNELLYPKTE